MLQPQVSKLRMVLEGEKMKPPKSIYRIVRKPPVKPVKAFKRTNRDSRQAVKSQLKRDYR